MGAPAQGQQGQQQLYNNGSSPMGGMNPMGGMQKPLNNGYAGLAPQTGATMMPYQGGVNGMPNYAQQNMGQNFEQMQNMLRGQLPASAQPIVEKPNMGSLYMNNFLGANMMARKNTQNDLNNFNQFSPALQQQSPYQYANTSMATLFPSMNQSSGNSALGGLLSGAGRFM